MNTFEIVLIVGIIASVFIVSTLARIDTIPRDKGVDMGAGFIGGIL